MTNNELADRLEEIRNRLYEVKSSRLSEYPELLDAINVALDDIYYVALVLREQSGGELDYLEDQCLDLRCTESRNWDDSDVIWQVVEHHTKAPTERIIGQGMTPREAIAQSKLPEGHPDRWDYVPRPPQTQQADDGDKG